MKSRLALIVVQIIMLLICLCACELEAESSTSTIEKLLAGQVRTDNWGDRTRDPSEGNSIIFGVLENGYGLAVVGGGAGAGHSVYKVYDTMDGGTTWTFQCDQVRSGGGAFAVDITADGRIAILEVRQFWASATGSVYLTLDGFQTCIEKLGSDFFSEEYRECSYYSWIDVLSFNVTEGIIVLGWKYEEDGDYWYVAEYDLDFNLASEVFADQDEMIKHLPDEKQLEALAETCPNGIIPISNEVEIDEETARVFLARCGMVTDDLRIQTAINEIYARKGYDFSETDFEEYFNSFAWYSPIYQKTINEDELTPCEKHNIELLVSLKSEHS